MKLQILKEGFERFLTELAASTFFSYIQKAANADGTYNTGRLKSLFDGASKAPKEFTLFNVEDPGKGKTDVKFLLHIDGHESVNVDGDAWSNAAGGDDGNQNPFPTGELVLVSSYVYKGVNNSFDTADRGAGGNASLKLKIVVGRQMGEVSELIHGYELSLTWQNNEVGVLASHGHEDNIRPKSSTISIDPQGKIELAKYVQGALDLMKNTRGTTLTSSGGDFIPTGKARVSPIAVHHEDEVDNV